MITYHLKTIIRQFWRQPFFTGIHFVGLTMACFAMLSLYHYISYQSNFDQHHADADRIFRVVHHSTRDGIDNYSSTLPYPLTPTLRAEAPELEKVGGIHSQGPLDLQRDNGDFHRAEDTYFADAGMAELYDFRLHNARDIQLLDQPGVIFLSESTAQTMFGNQVPIDQTIRVTNLPALRVAGIFEDPTQSTLLPDAIISLPTLSSEFLNFDTDSWGVSVGGATFVKLPPNTTPDQFQPQLADVVARYMDSRNSSYTHELHLQPLSDLHFDTRFNNAVSVEPIKKSLLWVAAAIGTLILLLASFNFVNLSLAQQMRREQDVQTRRILGAESRQLWFQQWAEALCLVLISGLSGLALWLAFGDKIIGFWQTQGQVTKALPTAFAWLFPAALLAISLLAGGYPAWVVSRQGTSSSLQGSKLVGSRSNRTVRYAILTVQFAITLSILVGAIAVHQQLDFIKNKDLGFNQDAVLQVQLPQSGAVPTLREAWLQSPHIKSVTFSLGAPTSNANISTNYHVKGSDPNTSSHGFGIKVADESYAPTYDLKIVAGRHLNAQDHLDIGAGFPDSAEVRPIVINETMAKEMGFQDYEQVLGKQIVTGINHAEGRVVGVVADFHHSSLENEVESTALMALPPLYYAIGVRFAPNQIEQVLSHLEKGWNTHLPDANFEYTFLDEAIAEQYLAEGRMVRMLQIFSFLAIAIACLGLLGITAILLVQRKKEISLRKVLGASIPQLWALLSKEFLILVVVATIIATPLAWWGINEWLNGYAYRIPLSPWVFVGATASLLLLTSFTVSWQAVRAALANPVEALKNEG